MLNKNLKSVCLAPKKMTDPADGKTKGPVIREGKDVISISGKVATIETKNLSEAAKLIKFEKKVKKLINELNSIYYTYNNNGSCNIIEPLKLREISNSEIIDKLKNERGVDIAWIKEGEEAISKFKKEALRPLVIEKADKPNIKMASTILDKIIKLFQNSGFIKIIASADNDDGRIYGNPVDCGITHLLSATKDKQLIGLWTMWDSTMEW